MIRTRSAIIPTRRIAVIEMPRRAARIGTIRSATLPLRDYVVGWSTVNDEPPESSGNFLSTVLAQQDQARLNTPGTLDYTPASDTPTPNVAPWNSWQSPNCPADVPAWTPDGATPAAPPAEPGGVPFVWAIAGILAAAAAAKYVFSGKGKH